MINLIALSILIPFGRKWLDRHDTIAPQGLWIGCLIAVCIIFILVSFSGRGIAVSITMIAGLLLTAIAGKMCEIHMQKEINERTETLLASDYSNIVSGLSGDDGR